MTTPQVQESVQCPWCGRSERNDVLLRVNHCHDSPRAEELTWRVSMDLTLSHVIYWSRVGEGIFDAPDKRDSSAAFDHDLARAEVVWANRLPELQAALAANNRPRPGPGFPMVLTPT